MGNFLSFLMRKNVSN